MEWVDRIVLVLHLVGWAMAFGGAVAQLPAREPEIARAMLLGSPLQLITGVGLALLALFGSGPVNQLAGGVQLAITLLVVILIVLNRRFTSIPRGLLGLLIVGALASIAIPVLWR